MKFGYRTAVQADIRRQKGLTFWVKVRVCLYRLVQQPYSLQPKAYSRIEDYCELRSWLPPQAGKRGQDQMSRP